MRSRAGMEFLPFTFYQLVKANGKDFYILGDTGIDLTGVAFLGLEIPSGKIHYLLRDKENKLYYKFVNQSLYQYLMCLAYCVNFFDQDYPHPSPATKAQVQADYQKLKENMTQVDAQAMADRNCFWAELVDRVQVGGLGDYFSDLDYEISEPLTPEEQERIDKMDLPF